MTITGRHTFGEIFAENVLFQTMEQKFWRSKVSGR